MPPGAGVEWEEGAVTGTIGLREGDPPAIDPAVTSLLRTRAGLIGPLTTPLGAGIEAIEPSSEELSWKITLESSSYLLSYQGRGRFEMGPGCSSLPPGLLPWESRNTKILSLKAFRELPRFGNSFTMFILLSVWGGQPQDLTLTLTLDFDTDRHGRKSV